MKPETKKKLASILWVIPMLMSVALMVVGLMLDGDAAALGFSAAALANIAGQLPSRK